MKRFLIISFCAVVIMASLPFSASAATTNFNIPEPVCDEYNYYFANNSFLFEIKFPHYLTSLYSEANTQSGGQVDYYSGRAFHVSVDIYSSNSSYCLEFTLWADNSYGYDVIVPIYVWNHSGSLYRFYTLSIPAGQTVYVFRSGYPCGTGYYPFNCDLNPDYPGVLQIPLLTPQFADDIAVSNEYTVLNTALNNLYNSVSTIIQHDSTYYTLIEDFLSDFLSTDFTSATGRSFYDYVDAFSNYAYNMEVFANVMRDWYLDAYVPKTDLTNDLLAELIADTVGDPDETPSYDSDEQDAFYDAVDTFQDAEMAAGADADIAGGLSDTASDVSGIFTTFGDAFSFIKQTIEEWIISNPALNSLIIFTVVMGLVVMLLGRKVTL